MEKVVKFSRVSLGFEVELLICRIEIIETGRRTFDVYTSDIRTPSSGSTLKSFL